MPNPFIRARRLGLLALLFLTGPFLVPATTPAEESDLFDLVAARTALIPKREIGAGAFLAQNPAADGRGTVIAIFDTGVDPAAPGLAVTTTGERKVVDVIDATGSGDVDTTTKVKPTAEGTLPGLSGRTLTLPAGLTNPSGEYRLGLKRADELFPGAALGRLNARETARQRAGNSLRRAARDRQPTAALLAAQAKAPVDRTRAELDLIARHEALLALEDEFARPDRDRVYDCVLWHDGEHWRVIVDTARDGDLAAATILRPYGVAGEYAFFDDASHTTFAVQVYAEGDLLSIVTVSGTHGSHVAAIAASHFPEEPARNGIAPGAGILSIKIGDVRNNGSSTGFSEQRALAAAARHGVDIVNASWGGGSIYQDGGNAMSRAYQALVERHDILAVVSAGNNGPALSTGGNPGGEADRVLGVGAYVSTEMGRVLYQTLADHPSPDATLQFSSRDPAKDGYLGVDVLAPGAAWASYSAESLRSGGMSNGTSMSAPAVAGAAALLISAGRPLGLDVSPARLRAALKLGVVPVPGEDDAPDYGAGLVHLPSAWDRLQALQDEPAFSAFYDLSVSGGTFTSGGRGLHVREPADRLRQRVVARVTPAWSESTDLAARYDFATDLVLRPADGWIEAPAYVRLANATSNIALQLTLPDQPGVTVSRVDAFVAGRTDLGPVFSIPITVVRPEPAERFAEHRFTTQVPLTPAATRRWFFQAPANATRLRLEVRHLAGTDPVRRSFAIHGLTLSAESRHTSHNQRTYLGLDPEETRIIDIPVKAGHVAEVAFHQFFSSPGDCELEVHFEWIGLGLPETPTLMQPNHGWGTLPLAPLGTRQVKVEAKLEHAERALLPTRTRRLPMDERAEMPPSPLAPESSRPVYLRQYFTLEFKSATRAALLHPQDYDLGEGISGGFLHVVHESGEVLLTGMGRRNNVINFPKGKTTVIRDFAALTHEAWLDSVEHTPLRIAEPVRGNRTLPVRASLRHRFTSGDTTTLDLVHGREAVIFLRDTQADDMADLDPKPAFLSGKITFKDSEDRSLGEHPLVYLPGTSAKKAVNAPARPKPSRDERPPAEQLADTLFNQRLTFIRSHRARNDAATQERRVALLDELRAERPDDPAPIFEAALDQALAAGLAGSSWGRLGQAKAETDAKADADETPDTSEGDEAAAEGEPVTDDEATNDDATDDEKSDDDAAPAREVQADALPAILELLDAAVVAADPDTVSRYLGAVPVAPPGDVAARHAIEREKKKHEDTRNLLARVARLRADVLRGAGQLDEAWKAYAEIGRWESSPAKETRRLESTLHDASGHLGLALQALNQRLQDDPHDRALRRERIALYRRLNWETFAEREEQQLAQLEQQRKLARIP